MNGKTSFRDFVAPCLASYQQATLLYETEDKHLFWAVDNNREVVLKFFMDQTEAQNEINVLQDLGGRPHIVKLYDWKKWNETDLTLLILEYKPTICYEPTTTSELANYAYQVLEALQILHSNCVIHADIKPDNILVDSNKSVTLIDFGGSVDELFSKVRGRIGTFPYMAPEVIKGECLTAQCDVWSLGLLLAEKMLQKRFISSPTDLTEVYEGKLNQFDSVASQFDSENSKTHDLWTVVKSMLSVNPRNRISSKQARQQIESLFGKPDVCNCFHK